MPAKPSAPSKKAGCSVGDYTKLIVNAEVRIDEALLREKIKELNLCTSAYHCSGNVEFIEKGANRFDEGLLRLILVGQTKWGDRQGEFLDWLRPFVAQGSGSKECYAMQFSEYQDEPTCFFGEG